MAAYKNFLVSYIFADGQAASVKVKAPKYPSCAAIAKALAKAGITLPEAPEGAFEFTRCTLDIGMGGAILPMEVFAASGSGEIFMYSYSADEIK